MPGKVSIGQYRNKKDPHRGRKRLQIDALLSACLYRNKKDPHRGRKQFIHCVHSVLSDYRNKKDPHRGRKPLSRVNASMAISGIETKKIPIGDGNILNL